MLYFIPHLFLWVTRSICLSKLINHFFPFIIPLTLSFSIYLSNFLLLSTLSLFLVSRSNFLFFQFSLLLLSLSSHFVSPPNLSLIYPLSSCFLFITFSLIQFYSFHFLSLTFSLCFSYISLSLIHFLSSHFLSLHFLILPFSLSNILSPLIFSVFSIFLSSSILSLLLLPLSSPSSYFFSLTFSYLSLVMTLIFNISYNTKK